LLPLSVRSSGRIFNPLVLTRLAPIPGSLAALAGLLVSIIAFQVSAIELDYATNLSCGQTKLTI
jgi:hypothetical protein